MMRIRLNVPLNLFLNADDPSLLDPSLSFDHGNSKIRVTLKGGNPLRLDKGEEPHFRTISQCQIEIQKEDAADGLPKLVGSKDYQELVNSLMPIVNRTLAAVRNFGWVTTAREYKPEHKPEVLLRAWEAKARIRGKWREIASKPKKDPFDYLGLSDLDDGLSRMAHPASCFDRCQKNKPALYFAVKMAHAPSATLSRPCRKGPCRDRLRC
jgi:hypothetical protein